MCSKAYVKVGNPRPDLSNQAILRVNDRSLYLPEFNTFLSSYIKLDLANWSQVTCLKKKKRTMISFVLDNQLNTRKIRTLNTST